MSKRRKAVRPHLRLTDNNAYLISMLEKVSFICKEKGNEEAVREQKININGL